MHYAILVAFFFLIRPAFLYCYWYKSIWRNRVSVMKKIRWTLFEVFHFCGIIDSSYYNFFSVQMNVFQYKKHIFWMWIYPKYFQVPLSFPLLYTNFSGPTMPIIRQWPGCHFNKISEFPTLLPSFWKSLWEAAAFPYSPLLWECLGCSKGKASNSGIFWEFTKWCEPPGSHLVLSFITVVSLKVE